MSPGLAADRKSPERFTVTLGPCVSLLRDRKAGEISKGQETAAVHEAAAIHVARLGDEPADHPSLLVRAGIKRARSAFERVVLPRFPTRPGAGFDEGRGAH
jgi:hypothetical protein